MISGSVPRIKRVRVEPGRAVLDPDARRADEPLPNVDRYGELESSAVEVWKCALRLYVPSTWQCTLDEGIAELDKLRGALDAVTEQAIQTRQKIGGRLVFAHASQLAPTYAKVAALAFGLLRHHPVLPVFARRRLESEQQLRVDEKLGGIVVWCVLLLVVNGYTNLEKALRERLRSIYPETLSQFYSGTEEHPYPYTYQEIAALLRQGKEGAPPVDETSTPRKRMHDLHRLKLPAAIAGLDIERLLEELRNRGNR